jgi:hypothetical protein
MRACDHDGYTYLITRRPSHRLAEGGFDGTVRHVLGNAIHDIKKANGRGSDDLKINARSQVTSLMSTRDKTISKFEIPAMAPGRKR